MTRPSMTPEERIARNAQRKAETAEKIALAKYEAELANKRRNTLRWATWTLIVFLSASVAANVLSVELTPISVFIAVVAPVSLFASTKLFMVLGVLRRPWLIYTMMVASILIAGWSSYWHIVDLILTYYGNPWGIAYLTPIAMDVPMMMAGVVLSQLRSDALPKPDKTPEKPIKKATPTKASQNGHAKPNQLATV